MQPFLHGKDTDFSNSSKFSATFQKSQLNPPLPFVSVGKIMSTESSAVEKFAVGLISPAQIQGSLIVFGNELAYSLCLHF